LVDEWLLPIGLRDLEVIAVSGQPCAILHGAIGLAVDWLKTLDESAALLVVGADVANHDGERCFFNSIMGDSAVAGLLTSASQRHRVLATYVETNIIAPGGELSEVDLIAKFRVHNAQYICAAIEACLAKAGLLIGDISLIAPHTPNRQIWDLVSELIRFPRERILTEYLEQSGHLNSNDSLAHYIRAVGDGRICQGERVLLVNPGFGGTRGCTLLQA
jgi:3-oxoacyl-[acyl-carrier-protein] synthase-3